MKDNTFKTFTISVISLTVSYITFVVSVNLDIFNQTLDKLLKIEPHITINKENDVFYRTKKIISENYNDLILEDATDNRYTRIIHYKDTLKKINNIDEIKSSTLNIKSPALLLFDGYKRYLYVNLVIPNPNLNISKYMKLGRFIEQEDNNIIIGANLARQIKAKFNDRLKIISPVGTTGTYKLTGMFETGFRKIDRHYAYIPYKEGLKIIDSTDAAGGIDIDLYNYNKANKVALKIKNITGHRVTSWIDKFKDIYNASFGFNFLKWFIYLLTLPLLFLNFKLFGFNIKFKLGKFLKHPLNTIRNIRLKKVQNNNNISNKVTMITALAIGIIGALILIALYNFFVTSYVAELFGYNQTMYGISFLNLLVALLYLGACQHFAKQKPPGTEGF